MRSKDEIIAILVSDLHLTEKPPIARSAEEDWYAAMNRPLQELRTLQKEAGNPIILCAGDIFDRWNSSPSLINWAIDHLPQMWAIPGQHDLPYHNWEQLGRSAFWTLVEADTIVFPSTQPYRIGGMKIHFYPYGFPIEPCPKSSKDIINIAVAHEYHWVPGSGHPQASEEDDLTRNRGMAKLGYDVIHLGDNHSPFTWKCGKTTVCNSGTLLRRKIDEKPYQVGFHLLYSDGRIDRYPLDTSKDQWIDQSKALDPEKMDLSEFIRGLQKLGGDSLDFKQFVLSIVEKDDIPPEVREIILQALEEASNG